MKQIELKKFKFENQGKSRLIALSNIFDPLRFQIMEQNHNVLFEFSDTSRQLQKKSLIDEMNSVFIEKHEFENWAESIVKTFWFFRTISYPTWKTWMIVLKFVTLSGDTKFLNAKTGWNLACSYGELWGWNYKYIKILIIELPESRNVWKN